MALKTTLNQWLTLAEIDKAGSIQGAATALNKSHTTLIYAIRKLESQMGVALVQVQGRRAVLTDHGKSLLRRAQAMIEQANALEEAGTQLARGMEAELTVAIDHLCDRDWLYQPLAQFLQHNSTTSVQIVETSLTKTTAMVEQQQADLAIINIPIANHSCDAFGITTMRPVVARSHPLAQVQGLRIDDLAAATQIVVRDLGSNQHSNRNVGWLKSTQRITVDNFDHAWNTVKLGLGYCRLPQHVINAYSDDSVVVLAVAQASSYQIPLHLTLPKGVKSGPAALQLHQLLLDSVNQRSKG
ncbi:LysR family transcriptional regulator [uncultured Ferrimonas sp.]|uniref:LysR family transcriptional regulator n=1 Tax=uncultured Ferrimonas sp. TaxID=432640 RepID=UPI0026132E9D|nr:LysR family transcriptional regulator [uncultured Ferrimonas sp.]